MKSFPPEHIAVSKSKGLRIGWKDSHPSHYPLKYLRDHCPCAACTHAHPTGAGAPQSPPLFPLYKPVLKIEAVEPVGNYAIRIRWNDGHNTGIYSFEYLRRICPCAACAARTVSD